MIAVAAVASHRTARIFTEAPAINQSDMALSKRPCSSAETDEKASQKQDTSINSGTAMDNTSHSYSTSEAARLETDRGRLAMDRSSVASLTRPGLPANLPHLNLEHLQALEQAKVVPPASPSPVASEASTLEEIETPFGQPINFGCVVPGVYRSSFPRTEQAYEYLKGLNLKTIVTLVNKDYPEGYEKFIHDNGIKHYVFDMVGTKKEAIPLSTMAAILRLVRDQRHYPMLIHCNHGRHRTGCVVAVARLMAGWDRAAILDEYKKYAEPKIRECDIEYITQFDLTQLSGALAGDTKLRKMGNFVRETIASFFVLVVWLFTGEIWSRHNARPAEKGPAEKGPAEKCGN